MDLRFTKGKNVIVGKNNSGKSNIIKAIDIVLGESSPAYQKYENITINDFHCGNLAEPVYIFCILKRDENEQLNYNEIYKCYGFKIHANVIQRHSPRRCEPITHHLSEDNLEEFWSDLEALMNLTEDEVDTDYINPKLRNKNTFENQFENKLEFAYAFRAQKDTEGKISKDIRFFYRQTEMHGWVMAFSAPVRNEFLQSAIIPSFRDPQNELRINQWSWYGKLLRNYINPDNPDLESAFRNLKAVTDIVFSDLKENIDNSKVKIAFPDTSISFQFNPNTKMDIYKSALIYVDDGFNSLLQEKGSGIQSAVIIGLFDYYTRKIAHRSCSLLSIEEPELYLHPQARRVISNRLDEFLDGNKNQVIISTHSSEFITSTQDSVNIICVCKENQNSVAKNTSFNSKERQILVKSQNAEMFFADIVILVEGGEKHILQAIAKYYGIACKPELGPNWIDDKNISILSVGGKSEFWKYTNKLNELSIRNYIVADFDFFLRNLGEFLTYARFEQALIDNLNALKSDLGHPNIHLARKIVEEITKFKNLLDAEGYELDEKDIKVKIKEPFKIKKLDQIKPQFIDDVRAFLALLRERNIFILENELEDYYTDLSRMQLRGIHGKEEKPIYLVTQCLRSYAEIPNYINCFEYLLLFDIVASSI